MMHLTAGDLDALVAVANALADAARPIARRYFRADDIGTVDKTAGGTIYDPVTLADRGIEAEMRRILAHSRPDDGIFGEEFGKLEGKSGLTWVLDPIDGTRGFVCGLSTWGVLIALNDGVHPVIGVMDQPIAQERFIGISHGDRAGAYLADASGTRALRTRNTQSLAGAVLCTTTMEVFDSSEAERFNHVAGAVGITRMGTDCYGYAMLAAGQVDLVIESGLNPYDIQALIPLIEAAGGVVTSWQGGDAQHGGQVIAAATPELHAEARKALAAD